MRRPRVRSANFSGFDLSRQERLQDGAAARAEDVAHDLRELEVGVFEGLLNPQRVPGDLTDQLLARSREIAERLNGRGRHETAADQAVREEIRDPRRIVHVALAPRHIADVHRVGW